MMDTALREGRKREGLTEKVKQVSVFESVIHEVMMDTALREGRKREGLTEKVKQVSKRA